MISQVPPLTLRIVPVPLDLAHLFPGFMRHSAVYSSNFDGVNHSDELEITTRQPDAKVTTAPAPLNNGKSQLMTCKGSNMLCAPTHTSWVLTK